MTARLVRQVVAAVDLLRPATFFRTLARVDQVSDRTRELAARLEALQVRTEQLEAIARIDWERQGDLVELAGRLHPQRIEAHVARAVAAAPLTLEPFPHIVVHDWLPDDIYDTMIAALPPAIFFAGQEPSRARLVVPFSFAPTYSRRVWNFVAEEIVGRSLRDALACKFEDVVREYVRSFSMAPDLETDLTLHPSDGRIMLRRPGYLIPPHRDPKWGFVTGLIYLAREGDNEAFGTRLYCVRDDTEAPSDKPYYVDESRCELVESVPFRRNTLLAFLNSGGAHGASIPADAEPASLERYVYQFRLGPDSRAIKQLLDSMPAERRELWRGAKASSSLKH